MQRAVIDDSQARAGNGWAIGRRDFLLRELVDNYAFIVRQCLDLAASGSDKHKVMATLLGSPGVPGPLRGLPRLCGFIWPQGSEFSDFGQLLRWQGERVAASLQLAAIGRSVAAKDDFAAALDNDLTQLVKLIAETNAKLFDVLRLEAGNPLFLRLLLENPELSVTLWQKDLTDLCEEFFPSAPETVYLYAAKSYFNGYWLTEALAAFEQALALNPDLEEARRKSHVVRGMLRDQRSRDKFSASA